MGKIKCHWAKRSFYVGLVGLFVLIIIGGIDEWQEYRDDVDDKTIQKGDLVYVEYYICRALIDNRLCPLSVVDSMPLKISASTNKEVAAIHELFKQILDYQKQCKSMNTEERNKRLQFYHEMSHQLRMKDFIVWSGTQYNANMPKIGSKYEKDADSCYEELKITK